MKEGIKMKIVDMHCDTISRLLELEEKGTPEGLRENTGHLDLLRMKQGGYLLQNFALFVEISREQDPGRRSAGCMSATAGSWRKTGIWSPRCFAVMTLPPMKPRESFPRC